MRNIPVSKIKTNHLFKKLGIEKRYYHFSPQPYLKIYMDEEIKSFERFYNHLIEVSEIFNNPTVGDVKQKRFNELIKKYEKARENYLKYVPEEFRNKFNFDINKLEEMISSLEKEYINRNT